MLEYSNMKPAAVRIEPIQAEAEALGHYLHTLPPDAWRQPSACQGWEVRDVVGHLVDVAEFYVEVITRGLQGDVSPPAGVSQGGTVTAEVIAQYAIAARERLGDRLLPTFKARYEQLCLVLAGLSPGDWETLCYYASEPKQRPVREYIPLSVQELAIHGWDIRSGLAPPAHLSTTSLAVLVQHTPRRLGRPRLATFPGQAMLPTPLRYRWQLTGVVAGAHDIVVEHGRCRMEPAATAVPQVTFRCEAETFVLLMYRRLALAAATATGRLAVEGDNELIVAFDQWLTGELNAGPPLPSPSPPVGAANR